jgi:predicted metal-dependent phosphoesterase TrpH
VDWILDTLTLGRADLHMHTKASDGIPTIRELLDYVAQRTNLDVIAITDHDRVDAALWACDHRHEYPFDIIPGIEVSSAAGHVLGLWVTRPIPKHLSLEETTAAIHEQGGVAILAHPYHVHIGVIWRNFLKYTRYPEILINAGLDALEAYNAGIVIPGGNILAHILSRRAGMAITGGSDAHTLGGVGCGITRFPGHTAEDLRQAIAQSSTIAEGKAWPLIDYWNYSRNSTHNISSEFLVENVS